MRELGRRSEAAAPVFRALRSDDGTSGGIAAPLPPLWGLRPTTVVAGTVVYGRDGAPRSAPVIADLPDGRRIVAKASDETLANMSGRSLAGESVHVTGAHPPIYTR